jgi:predicted MPP superfamily phosphohydrolase
MKSKPSKHFHLTLSGHTHGMQFELKSGLKWSLHNMSIQQWAGFV